jgi:arginase family enzyme
LAVKIIRQPKKIVLIGAPTSAAANAAGCEAAPAALRKAGIAARLEQIGYEVSDAGDIAANAWRADDETPRARNAAATVKSLHRHHGCPGRHPPLLQGSQPHLVR